MSKQGNALGIIAILAVTCFVTVTWSASNKAPKSGKKTAAKVAANTVVESPYTRVEDVPDVILRTAIFELSNSVQAYEPPVTGDGDVGKVMDICLKARAVFRYLEWHQICYGVESMNRIKPLVRDLYSSAADKLSWVEKRPPNEKRIRLVYDRMKSKLETVSSDEPIPPAPVANLPGKRAANH